MPNEEPVPVANSAAGPKVIEMNFDSPPCEWTYDELHWKWDTSCGEGFQFTNDGPEENGFNFCPYCSLAIKPVVPEHD